LLSCGRIVESSELIAAFRKVRDKYNLRLPNSVSPPPVLPLPPNDPLNVQSPYVHVGNNPPSTFVKSPDARGTSPSPHSQTPPHFQQPPLDNQPLRNYPNIPPPTNFKIENSTNYPPPPTGNSFSNQITHSSPPQPGYPPAYPPSQTSYSSLRTNSPPTGYSSIHTNSPPAGYSSIHTIPPSEFAGYPTPQSQIGYPPPQTQYPPQTEYPPQTQYPPPPSTKEQEFPFDN
jgi:hypothetical protein